MLQPPRMRQRLPILSLLLVLGTPVVTLVTLTLLEDPTLPDHLTHLGELTPREQVTPHTPLPP